MTTSWRLAEAAQLRELEWALVDMERNGFALDVPYLASALDRAKEDEVEILGALGRQLSELGVTGHEVNYASPSQLIDLLHNKLGLPPAPVWKKGKVRLADGERKTDEVALSWIADHVTGVGASFVRALVELRRVRGSIKYLGKLPGFIAPDGFVHPVCGPSSDADPRAGTITWRLASKNPEVQQIPKSPKKDRYRIRRGFVAPEGYRLIIADEKALEVAILAHLFIVLFDDHQLAEMVAPGAPDVHSVNARRVFGEMLGWERHGRGVVGFDWSCFKDPDYPELCALREDIKAVWYGLMYGKTVYGFGTSLKDHRGEPVGEDTARKIVEALYAALPALPRYQAWVLDYITRYHGIPGLGGAWCDLSELTKTKDKWKVARAQRIAQNYPCQEGGARIIGHAMVGISRDVGLRASGLLIERQIHDELDFRVPDRSPIGTVTAGIEKHMTSYPLRSALQVSIGTGHTWEDGKS